MEIPHLVNVIDHMGDDYKTSPEFKVMTEILCENASDELSDCVNDLAIAVLLGQKMKRKKRSED